MDNALFPQLFCHKSHEGLVSFTPILDKDRLEEVAKGLEKQGFIPEFALRRNGELAIRTDKRKFVSVVQGVLDWMQRRTVTSEKQTQTELPIVSLKLSLPEFFSVILTRDEERLLSISDLSLLLYECYRLVGILITCRVREEKPTRVCAVLAKDQVIAEGRSLAYRKAKAIAHIKALARLNHGFLKRWLDKHPRAIPLVKEGE